MKAFRFFFLLLALCAPSVFGEEEPSEIYIQTCPMPALKESLNKAYADLTEDPDNQEKGQMFVDLFEKSLHKYDCRRPFDTGPVPAWWLSLEPDLLFENDAIKWINLLASMKSTEAKNLFGSQLFRSTLDGVYAEMYYELSLQAEKELQAP